MFLQYSKGSVYENAKKPFYWETIFDKRKNKEDIKKVSHPT